MPAQTEERKHRRKDRQKDGQNDGQTLFYRTLPATARRSKHVILNFYKTILNVPNDERCENQKFVPKALVDYTTHGKKVNMDTSLSSCLKIHPSIHLSIHSFIYTYIKSIQNGYRLDVI